MVGFSPEGGPELSKLGYSISGAASGVITRAMCQPLDVLKIRFQLQNEPIRRVATSKYHSIVQASAAIYRDEGLASFWKGHVPAQGLSFIYGVVQFTTFEVLTKAVWLYLPAVFTTELQPITHFSCGGLAGCVAMTASHPCDVLRTRFVAQGEPKTYTSILSAASHMKRTEGLLSFYKGLTPALLQIAPQTGLQFGFYSLNNKLWRKVFGEGDQSKFDPLRSLVCGSLAGVFAKLIIYPLDLTKKRLQIQGFEAGRRSLGRTDKYTGLINCIRTVLAQEGFTGLYKGLSPSLLKAVISVGLNFWTYELCCHLVKDVYGKR